MTCSRRSAASAALALFAVLGILGLAGQDREPPRLDPLKADADQMAAKIARIQAIAQSPAEPGRAPVRTVLTEAEINAYLFWNGDEVLPIGLTDPRIRLAGDGHVSANAVVDLTAIRNQRERGWLDPLAYVGGQMPVVASGVVRTRDGLATIELGTVTIGGVEVPRSVLQELVSYYTRSAESPGGVSLDAPIAMPAAIREVTVGKGEAVVIQ